LPDFPLPLFLPFADIQSRIRAANGSITLIVDRSSAYRVELTIPRLREVPQRAAKRRFSFCSPEGLLVRVQPEERPLGFL